MLLTLALALAVFQDPPGAIRGLVRSEATGAPLAYATVEVLIPSQLLAVTADSVGRYHVRNVPAGRWPLRAHHLDHAPLVVHVLVPPGGDVALDLALELRPVPLPPVAARAAPDAQAPLERPGDAGAGTPLGPSSVRAIEATPGVAELGLADFAREVPGYEPVDPSDVLYIRGGAADLKLVLLDGAPVYAPFHLGGLIEAFEPDVLGSAALYVGGAPARYDGGLSYVLELETRPARDHQVRFSGAADLLAGRGVFEAGMGPLRLLVGGRTLHDASAGRLTREPFPYQYADALARLDFALGGPSVAATAFWNQEGVRLDDPGIRQPRWGNAAGSVRLRAPLAGMDAELTLAAARFDAELPVGGTVPLLADGAVRRTRAALHFDRPAGETRLQFGGSIERQELRYAARPRRPQDGTFTLTSNTEGDVAGIYAEGDWRPTSRLSVRGGLRLDAFSVEASPRLAHRASLRLQTGERVALTLAAGRYHQYVRAPAAPVPTGTPTADATALTALAVAGASHVVLGLDQQLGESVRLGLEGFYKELHDVPVEAAAPEDAFAAGQARSSGVDLWLRRSAGSITGWLGYSLAWVWTQDRAGAFAGRHLLSAGATGSLGAATRFEVRVAYGAGLPYTAVPDGAPGTVDRTTFATARELATDADARPLLPTPDEPYLRLDATAARTFKPRWRGAAMELTPYLRVLNALDRRDALFYRFDGGRDAAPRALAALPLIPVLGIEWQF